MTYSDIQKFHIKINEKKMYAQLNVRVIQKNDPLIDSTNIY